MLGSQQSRAQNLRRSGGRRSATGSFISKLSGAGISAIALAAVGGPMVAVAGFLAVDGFADQALSRSVAGSIENISEATAADDRSVIQTQGSADLRLRIADQTLSQTNGYLAGDQFWCLAESFVGGIYSMSPDLYEQSKGHNLQQNCYRRAARGGDLLRDQVSKSLNLNTGH